MSEKKQRFGTDLKENIIMLREMSQNTNGLLIRELTLSGCHYALISGANLINSLEVYNLVVQPLKELETEKKGLVPEDIYQFIETQSMFSMEFNDVYDGEEAFQKIMSGFLLIAIDGIDKMISLGMQGFKYRSVSEPSNEVNQFGSNEAFTEVFTVNASMVRRRLKTPTLKFEQMAVGEKSKTAILIVYLTDAVEPKLVRDVKRRLSKIKTQTVLAAGYLESFLDGKPYSLFSTVGTTERPDTLCAKLTEGRVGIIVDGTRFAIVVPRLFVENFHSMDDYNEKPYYATMIRIIKYLGFFISVFLPGLSVALIVYSPELYPKSLLHNIVASQEIMPFPIMIEVLLINIIYDIMREAGLRAPKSIGHAVSIIGSLVIGDAAITAGIVSAPTVMMIAITAISAYVVPSLFQQMAFLRLIFILVGGLFGLYGICLTGVMLLTNMCVLHNYGISFLAPVSPFSWKSMRDVIYRQSWPKMQKRVGLVQKYPGSHINSNGGDMSD